MDEITRNVARALIDMNAVRIDKDHPLTFKSGMVAPIYMDNRRFPFHPGAWHIVIEGFMKIIDREKITFDVVGGIEAAGIPHSAALGYALRTPSVFIRKQLKDHGTKKMVEGGDISGKTVLVVEDLITTGSSSLYGVEALRSEGATVRDCLVIVTYGFQESADAFAKAGVALHPLVSMEDVLTEGLSMKKFSEDQAIAVRRWVKDPYHWTP